MHFHICARTVTFRRVNTAQPQTELFSPADLGELMRQQRLSLGLTQAALAERAGVSRRWLIKAEAGQFSTAIGMYMQVLDVLGLALFVGHSGSKSEA
ncbi:helix-turn-helix domain-containing protein [Galactobacter sp.]|uniref:helix-turn-helix domain-containing protein n=1 Tax=Galactobacter sp. TaxID=2676125 RepID=UPI0025C0B8FF|nr:helix-turn-helix domain-containing protein [Galactobacter sp.]